MWPAGASLVRNGNLAAVFTDQSQRQAERLVLAITAVLRQGADPRLPAFLTNLRKRRI